MGANFMRVTNMAKGTTSGQTDVCTRELFAAVCSKEREPTLLRKEIHILVILSTVRCTGREFSSGKMVAAMLANTFTTRRKVTESFRGPTAPNMTEPSQTES